MHVRMKDEHGFALVEVLAAMVILLVGLGGVLGLVVAADARSASTKAREGGVNLQREVLEAARSVRYAALTPVSAAPQIQAVPGLEDASASAAGWTVRRGATTYSVAAGACIVDDPRDGIGDHASGAFCATGAGRATPAECAAALGTGGDIAGVAGTSGTVVGDCGLDPNRDGRVDNLAEAEACVDGGCPATTSAATDTNPDDYKRVITLVRWDRGDGARYALQSTLVPNPGLAVGPAVTALIRLDPTSDASPITFQATTAVKPATVTWSINGAVRGTATATTDTTWGVTWELGDAQTTEDGPYVVAVQAFDAYGVPGPERATTVELNRAIPFAPSRFGAGRNGSYVEFEWAANRERDLRGYRVYAEGGADPVCALTTSTWCQASTDSNGPFYVVAYDRDPSGTLRAGQRSPSVTVSATNEPPAPPAELVGWMADGLARLSWTASSSSDVAYYRIYRDGTSASNRYATTAAGETTFADRQGGGEAHRYWVVAVDEQLAESAKVGPVDVGGIP